MRKKRYYLNLKAAVLACMVFFMVSTSGSESTYDVYATTTATDAAVSADDNEILRQPEIVQDNPASEKANDAHEGNRENEREDEFGKEDAAKFLKFIAVGDIMLGRGVGVRLEAQNLGYLYPFKNIADELKKGDIVFGNLEQPITDKSNSLDGRMKFVLKSKPESIAGLKFAGFNLLSLANNHIMDYYDAGLNDTICILEREAIAFCGAGKNLDDARNPAMLEAKGLKVGMLAYTDMAEIVFKGNPSIRFAAEAGKAGVAPRNMEHIKEDVDKLRSRTDILIVSLHWGTEESFEILNEQIAFAHELIDMGVDAILGHHPHQFQGIEIYKGRPIFYSLGNFIFDQNDPENQESFVVEMDYAGDKLVSLTAIPFRIVGKTRIEPQTEPAAANMLEREIKLSQKLGSNCKAIDGKIVFEIE